MRARLGAAFTVAVMVMVSSAMAVTGVSLLGSGDLVQAGVGVGVLLLVLVGVVLVIGEVRLGAASQRLAGRLAQEGGLPYDPPGVTRRASGRLDKADADAVFEQRKAEVEAAPQEWRAWWRLAAAYGEARDPRRGRRAMRRAVSLERASRAAPDPVPVTRVVEGYGSEPHQEGEWWVPELPGPLPTVVLVHGGYWREQYDLRLQDAVAKDLAGRGWLVWNIDYRSSAQPWPATLTDAAAAYDVLATGRFADRVDPGRVAVVGHSAGGHLALWLCSRSRLPGGAPGADPSGPPPVLAVAQAPVASLVAAADQRLGSGAVAALMDGLPKRVRDRYEIADPMALLPTGVPTLLLHSADDDLVPLSQSEAYVAAAVEAGDDSRLVRVPGGHFDHLDPTSAAGEALRTALRSVLS